MTEALDLTALENKPIEIAGRMGALCAEAAKAEIASQVDLEKAADLDKMLAIALKKGEEERVSYTKPLLDLKGRLDARFKPYKEAGEQARKIIQGKMMAWRKEQLRIAAEAQEKTRKEAEERALAEAAKLEAEGNADAAAVVLEDAVAPIAPAPPAVAGPARGNYGGLSSFIPTWSYEITDETAIPRQYLLVDHKRIAKEVKDSKGQVRIPGVKIVEGERVTTR